MNLPDDYKQLLAEVGDSLRTLRERDGWSIPEMAVIAGLEETEVRAIEAGEISFDTDTLCMLLSAIGFMSTFSDEIEGSVEETPVLEARYRITPRLMGRLNKCLSNNSSREDL